jgi:hypothetical protein
MFGVRHVGNLLVTKCQPRFVEMMTGEAAGWDPSKF